MKKKTKRVLRHMMILLKRKKAHFYYDENGQMRYAYPKYGWSEFRDVTGHVGVR